MKLINNFVKNLNQLNWAKLTLGFLVLFLLIALFSIIHKTITSRLISLGYIPILIMLFVVLVVGFLFLFFILLFMLDFFSEINFKTSKVSLIIGNFLWLLTLYGVLPQLVLIGSAFEGSINLVGAKLEYAFISLLIFLFLIRLLKKIKSKRLGPELLSFVSAALVIFIFYNVLNPSTSNLILSDNALIYTCTAAIVDIALFETGLLEFLRDKLTKLKLQINKKFN